VSPAAIPPTATQCLKEPGGVGIPVRLSLHQRKLGLQRPQAIGYVPASQDNRCPILRTGRNATRRKSKRNAEFLTDWAAAQSLARTKNPRRTSAALTVDNQTLCVCMAIRWICA
jgi:hypothetical protein